MQPTYPAILTVPEQQVAKAAISEWPLLDEVCYLPHGAVEFDLPLQTRSLDVVFAATYSDPDARRASWKRYPAAVQAWLGSQADRLLADPTYSAWMIGPRADDDPHQLVAAQAGAKELEPYLKGVRRRDFVHALTARGITATLVGEGWETHGDADSHQLLGSKSFAEVAALYSRARVVVHIAATSDSHERPLTAMLQGAAVVCETSPFFQQHFDDSMLLQFPRGNVVQAADRVVELLGAPTRCEALGAAGKAAVAAAHTWRHRGLEVADGGLL